MERPLLIGVTSRYGDAAWVEENTRYYLATLAGYGVTTVVLSPDTPATLPDGAVFTPGSDGRLPDALLDRLAGLVLAGGGDVDPKYFGAELAGANPDAIDVKRDELELALCRGALDRDLPVFGICRGCQVMNVAAGGGMVQHFDGHRSSKEAPRHHDVRVVAGSRLFDVLGVDCLPVNTYHHQGLDQATVAPALRAVGIAEPDNWLVEAVESDHHRWVLGVQWHPERLFELDDTHRKLWDSFIAACREG